MFKKNRIRLGVLTQTERPHIQWGYVSDDFLLQWILPLSEQCYFQSSKESVEQLEDVTHLENVNHTLPEAGVNCSATSLK